jgi:transposase
VRRRAEKKWDGSGGQDDRAPGRSRGGFGTERHGSFDGLGRPAGLILTPGRAPDIGRAEGLSADPEPGAVIADRGYDKEAPVEAIGARGGAAVIPTQKNRAEQRGVDPHRYAERNLCERFRARAEQFRRVATRYETKAANYLASAWLAAWMVMPK